MKIALCLSGQFRTFDRCYPSLKKYLLDVYNPDIYVYASEEKDMVVPDAKKVVFEKYRKSCWDTLFDFIVHPKNRPVLKPYQNSLIMFYMIYKCQQLVDHSDVSYDRVIRFRPDMMLNGRIPGYVFSDDNVLWYSSYAIDKGFQVSDKFLIGTPELMKNFTNVWKYIKQFWSTSDQLKDDNSLPVGERLVYQHLHGNNVPVASFDMECCIFRNKRTVECFKKYVGYLNGFFKTRSFDDTVHSVYDRLPFNIKMLIPPQLDQFKHMPDYRFNGGRDPFYIGVGFPKSGTSWWHQLILDHPCIVPNLSGEKEVTFFPHFVHRGLTSDDVKMYRGLFDTRGFSGEWSPGYVYHPFVLQHIYDVFPDVKLLVMLRNPVDAYTSLLNHQMQVKKRMLNVHGRRGYVYDVFSLYPECAYTFLYGHHISRILRLFKPEQVLFLQYELCKKYPVEYIQRTYEFLGVDKNHIPSSVGSRFNIRPYIVPKPKGDARRRIAGFYQDDVKQLQKLLPGFDYGLWRDF